MLPYVHLESVQGHCRVRLKMCRRHKTVIYRICYCNCINIEFRFRNATSTKQWYRQIDMLDVCTSVKRIYSRFDFLVYKMICICGIGTSETAVKHNIIKCQIYYIFKSTTMSLFMTVLQFV